MGSLFSSYCVYPKLYKGANRCMDFNNRNKQVDNNFAYVFSYSSEIQFMKKIFLLLVLILTAVTLLNAQKTGTANFVQAGQTSVDFQSAKGVITLPGNTAYKALRIKTDAPVHIESLSVVYQDGTPEAIPVRYDFKPGVESRDINLQGSKRIIKEIDFVYKQVVKSNAAKATVEILGSN